MVAVSDIYEQIKTEKPIAIVLTGDFNARSPLFGENDTDTREGRMFSSLMNPLISEMMAPNPALI